MCIDKPFLDNKETVGITSSKPLNRNVNNAEESFNWRQRRRYNRARCLRMSRQVKQNKLNYEQLHKYLDNNQVDLRTMTYLMDFRSKINSCCHHALFREHLINGATEFIGAHSCKHKLCSVCNAMRSKKTRQIWRRFFEKYPELVEDYDLMHLTLTVPHSEQSGYRGKRWYADELIKEFNYMRKKKFWRDRVYAGEFGIEVTRNAGGLHIHIHSLLLVYKCKQNRNELHKEILKSWNRQTSGSGDRTTFSQTERDAILGSNKLLRPLEVEKLAPDGATFIGLESLYLGSKERKTGFQHCDRSGLWKRYIRSSDNFETNLAGIMECIKYHFEPMAMSEDGSLDFDLIAEILPSIKGKPLYRKFGAFHAGAKNAHPGARMLNMNYKEEDIIQEMADDLSNNSHEAVINPETGEEALREEYIYFSVSLAKVFLDPEEGHAIKIPPNVKKTYFPAANALDALVEMEILAMARRKNLRNPIIKLSKYKKAC